jgi:ferredoxin
MYKVIQSRDECIGCGLCPTLASDIWEMDNVNNIAILKNGREEDGKFILEVSEDVIDDVRSAAESCAVDVIHLYDENGNDITQG